MKILIAEDNEETQLLLETLFVRNGYSVECAADGGEALEKALKSPPDLIISDVMMPGMNGFLFCRRAKEDERLKKIPFILYTGMRGEKDEEELALSLGAARFISKPLELPCFLDAVREELEKSGTAGAAIPAPTPGEAGERDRWYLDILSRKLQVRELELEEMRRSLAASEEKFRTLVETTGDWIWEIDRGGFYTYSSPRIAAILGYSREEIVGKTQLDFLPPEEAKRVGGLFAELAKTGRPIANLSKLAVHKNGRLITLESNGLPFFDAERKLAGYRGVDRDITERKTIEAGIHEAYGLQEMINDMLRRSLANIPLREKLNSHLAALLSTPWLSLELKGTVFLAGPRGRELVLTAHQGVSAGILAACAKVPFGRCLCGKAAETGRAVASRRVDPEQHTTYEGMPPHADYCLPIMAEGKVLGVLNLHLEEDAALTRSQERFINAAADVMAANILHARVEEKFAHAQKIEAVGLLAGGVAHDFNNILTAVTSYAELILRGLPAGDPKQADAREILNAAERAAALTRQLLAFGRRQIMTPRVLDLNQTVGDMVNMLKRLIGENIKLAANLFPAPCPADVDPGQIEQVLMNLVINARDAMPGGGVITLETEVLPAEKAARPDLPHGPLACIRVRDTGCGMAAEVKSRIFEPFFTTKEQGKGTGLGLSTAFGIVKQSGGEIAVESEPGKGATFIVYLPLAEPGKQEPAEDEAVPAKGRETILLVEDEESLLRVGARILAAAGYTVLTASGGAAALETLERRGKPVDLLLTDVVMPGMNGRELALELARRKLAGRVLYMSGYTDEAIVKHGVLEPGIAFIYKPFTAGALARKLREVLDGPPDQAKA